MKSDEKNRILDEAFDSIAALVSGGVELAQGASTEARSLVRSRFDKLIKDLDLVEREEFDVVRAQLVELEKRIKALEKN